MYSVGGVLVIAGSDSGGGAGLEADQKVIAAHSCYAMTVTTALTAQNTKGVHAVHYTPPDFVGKQLEAVLSDMPVDVVKIGMLGTEETIPVVSRALAKYKPAHVVLDPVMISTSGAELLSKAGIKELRTTLLTQTTILTPNVPEALLLLRDSGIEVEEPSSIADMIDLATKIHHLGPEWVVLKGGHLPLKENGEKALSDAEKQVVVDILLSKDVTHQFRSKYQVSNNTHGTGCSLASAIASNLSKGIAVHEAVKAAREYVEAGIKSGQAIGKGDNRPINHFHSTYKLPFPPGRFVEYLLNRADVKPAWDAHVNHEFLAKIANGTLSKEAFQYYLIQDYLYLVQYARATSLAGYKSKTIEKIEEAAMVVSHCTHEMNLHITYCNSFGVSKEQIMATEENEACTAYTRYVLDIGNSEDWMALQIAMAPCAIGYLEIGKRLYDDPNTKREGNPFWNWIEMYASVDFSESVKGLTDALEKHAVEQSSHRIEELAKIFIHATNMEAGFWSMGNGKHVEELRNN